MDNSYERGGGGGGGERGAVGGAERGGVRGAGAGAGAAGRGGGGGGGGSNAAAASHGAAAKEALKDEGNEHFKQGRYDAALAKYNQALDGHPPLGLAKTLLSNSAACHLALADALSSTGDSETRARKLQAYDEALSVAVRAVGLPNLSDLMHAKVLLRAGKAAVGFAQMLLLSIDRVDPEAEERIAKQLVGQLSDSMVITVERLKMAQGLVNDAQGLDIRATLREALVVQRQLKDKAGAEVLAEPPAPHPETFAAGVVFKEGHRWIDNQVFLEVPVRSPETGELVLLPLFLNKAWNVNNVGELAIWTHYSAHLGADVLKAKAEAVGVDELPYGANEDGDPFMVLSSPVRGYAQVAKEAMLQSRDEFISNLGIGISTNTFTGGVPDALERAGVIEFVRCAGENDYGDKYNVYRAKF